LALIDFIRLGDAVNSVSASSEITITLNGDSHDKRDGAAVRVSNPRREARHLASVADQPLNPPSPATAIGWRIN
jgi:hypothetical protein